MNCREFVEFLLDYLDEQLPCEQRETFERHMRDCPPCGKYLESYRLTIRLGQKACHCSDETPLPNVPEELIRAILDARIQQPHEDAE